MEFFAGSVCGSRIITRSSLKRLLFGATFLLFICISLVADARSSSWQSIQTNTWSIVAADPDSGDVGVAIASCVPEVHADFLAALAPGKGAAVVQARADIDNRNEVFDMLQNGDSASIIVDKVSDFEFDPIPNTRQYGVVTIMGGELDVAAFTGSTNPLWAGDLQNTEFGVTVQGGYLTGEEVVVAAMNSFITDDESGFNALPDRLMRALEAGSAAGGDSRCNNDQVTQTAATAAILVARGGDEPYAAESEGSTDVGTPDAPWLALSVAESRFGPNPILELRRQYDSWRSENMSPPAQGSSPQGAGLVLAGVVVIVILIILLLTVVRNNRRKSGKNP